MALCSKLCSVCADKCTVPFSPLYPCMAPLHPLPFSLSLSLHLPSPPLPSPPPLSGFPYSSVLSLHLPPLLCTHVLQLFQLLQDTWPLEGGFLHVHLLSISLSLSLSIFNPIRLSTHPQKGLYILALSFFIFKTNTTTNKFLCQDFSLDSFFFFCLLFSWISVFRSALSGVEFCKTNIWIFVHNWCVHQGL